MRTLVYMALFGLAVTLLSLATLAQSTEPCPLNPTDLNLVPMTDLEGDLTEAAAAVVASAQAAGLELSEFWVSVEARPGEVVYHLWHQTAFEPANCHMMGNPGGQCRDLVYTPNTGLVTVLFWQ